jgi:hypothetical protein
MHNGGYPPPDFNAIKKHFNPDNKIKFFEINFNTNQTNNQATIKYMFSKTLIIQTRINRSSYNQNWKHSTIKEVNIPNNILMVIKTLFSNSSSQYESESSAPQLFNFVDKYTKEPQLFMEKCPEFETICSQEYKKIEEMKESHRLNIEEFRQHYSDFKELQADIKKIKEEKEKLTLVKIALNNLAVEVNMDAKKNKEERAALADAKRTATLADQAEVDRLKTKTQRTALATRLWSDRDKKRTNDKSLAAKTQADLLKTKTERSKTAAALLALRLRRQIAQSKLPKASSTSTPTPATPAVTPAPPSELSAPSPPADAAAAIAAMLK